MGNKVVFGHSIGAPLAQHITPNVDVDFAVVPNALIPFQLMFTRELGAATTVRSFQTLDQVSHL